MRWSCTRAAWTAVITRATCDDCTTTGELARGCARDILYDARHRFRCDDHIITKCTLEQVLKAQAYLLFYHKTHLHYE
jgi:hypothetical protein